MYKDGLPVLTEEQEARYLIQWVSYHPIIKDIFIHITNEGKYTPQKGRRLKLIGRKKGVSDYFLAYPVGKFHGLWIELKRRVKSSLTAEQKIWLDKMKSLDYEAKVAYGWEDAKEIISQYLALSFI